MRNLFSIIILFLLFGCKGRVQQDDTLSIPKNSTLITLKLVDSLGNVQVCIPNRYDTAFQWTNWSDCGKRCAKVEYRYQPKNLAISRESGFIWIGEPEDSIERFTIYHSADFPFHIIKEKDYTQTIHKQMRQSLEMSPDTHKIAFDTIQKINDRFYSIFIIDQFLERPMQYSKRVIASTTVMGNGIQFNYELLTKNKDSITTNFINNSLELLNTIKISNGI